MSKVSGSRQRLARRYATSSGPERRSPYARARRTGVTSGRRSTLTPCQNVETDFMTPAATVLHNKSFLRAAATTYFSTSYVAHYSFQRARVRFILLRTLRKHCLYIITSNDDCEVLLCLLIIIARKEAHQ